MEGIVLRAYSIRPSPREEGTTRYARDTETQRKSQDEKSEKTFSTGLTGFAGLTGFLKA
jgi:hypothetical protein